MGYLEVLLPPAVAQSRNSFREGAKAGFESWLNLAFSESGTMPESKRPEACRDQECASLPSAGWNGHRTGSGAALLSKENLLIAWRTCQSSKTSSPCLQYFETLQHLYPGGISCAQSRSKRGQGVESSVHKALGSVSPHS